MVENNGIGLWSIVTSISIEKYVFSLLAQLSEIKATLFLSI
jgi:hypothetical protein